MTPETTKNNMNSPQTKMLDAQIDRTIAALLRLKGYYVAMLGGTDARNFGGDPCGFAIAAMEQTAKHARDWQTGKRKA